MPDSNLSFSAQSVLDAYRDESWTPDEEDNGRYYKFSHKAGMAAALRAATDQVVPEQAEPVGDSHDEARHDQWMRIRYKLFAIADELEGIKYGTYRCNLEDKPQ